MCIILYAKERRVSAEEVRQANSSNADGLGISWASGPNMTSWRKNLSLKEAIKLCKKLPMPYVLHARLATVGGKVPALCHPFPVTKVPSIAMQGSARSVLHHNGHIHDWDDMMFLVDGKVCLRRIKSRGPWSDSRAVAHMVAARGHAVLDLWGGNRFLIQQGHDVKTWGNWNDLSGVMASTWLYTPVYGRYGTMPDRDLTGKFLPTPKPRPPITVVKPRDASESEEQQRLRFGFDDDWYREGNVWRRKPEAKAKDPKAVEAQADAARDIRDDDEWRALLTEEERKALDQGQLRPDWSELDGCTRVDSLIDKYMADDDWGGQD